jgi:DNA helicase INO80
MRTSPDPDAASNHNDVQPGPAEKEGRPVSSDLEDCDILWKSELNDYIIYTNNRQQQIEKWFEASVIVSFRHSSFFFFFFFLYSAIS